MAMRIRLPKKQMLQTAGDSSDGEGGAPPPGIGQKPAKAKPPSPKVKASSSLPEAAPVKKPSASSSHSGNDGVTSSSAPIDPSEASASSLKSEVPASALPANPVTPTKTDGQWLTRKAAVAFLNSHGFPITVNRLAKYAVTGGGPPYSHWCGHVLYDQAVLLTWAWGLLVPHDAANPKTGTPT
jgi:hypothetical protein